MSFLIAKLPSSTPAILIDRSSGPTGVAGDALEAGDVEPLRHESGVSGDIGEPAYAGEEAMGEPEPELDDEGWGIEGDVEVDVGGVGWR
jgi:hypothetical protein